MQAFASMVDKRSARSRSRGKWIFVSCTFVMSVVLYIANTEQSMFKVEFSGHITPTKKKTFNSNAEALAPIQDKLLNSKWIKLFPNLENMVSEIDDTHTKHITSAEHTFVSIKSSSDNFEVGKILTAVIVAVDGSGQNKKYGGDFFFVSLRQPLSKNDGVSCDILDEMNGSYRVTCIQLWPGRAILNAVLIHPSESVYQMMKLYSSEKEYGVLFKNLLRNSTGSEELTLCTIGFPEKKQEELCDYSNPTNGEQWKCVKPKSGECGNITQTPGRVSDNKLLRFWDDVYFRKGLNYNVEIGGSGTAFTVKESTLGLHDCVNREFFGISPSPLAPSGWFFKSKWMFNHTMATDFSALKLQRCVQNTELYFVGDSTTRQWYTLFRDVLKVKGPGSVSKVVSSHNRDSFDKILNVTLHYRAHGPPLHNIGPPDAMPYISDTLDSIKKGGKGTKVFITLGYHFQLFDPDTFGSRLQIIKSSIDRLLERLPGTMIYFKGLHTHDYFGICPSPWLTYRYDIMMRHQFMGIKGVTYLPFWDLTSLAGNTVIHPVPSLLKQMVGFFLSFCNEC